MTKAKKFLKSSFIYFVGNILTKIISFFLLPMYTNYIPTGGMGYYDVINTYMNIIVPIVSVTIWAAILRYCFDFENRDDKYKVIFNAMFALFGSVIVYCNDAPKLLFQYGTCPWLQCDVCSLRRCWWAG